MVLACQRSALIEALLNACRNVPFYRAFAIDERTICTDPYGVLRNLPAIDKTVLAKHADLFVSDLIDEAVSFKNRTSGSTGVPLTTFHDVGSLVHEAACFRRAYTACPMKPGDRMARLVTDQSRPPWQRQLQLFYGPLDVAVINLHDSNGAIRKESIKRTLDWAPRGLIGNPSDLLIFATETEGLKIDGLGYVLTGGEVLTPNAKCALEKRLNVPVFDTYSMKEVAPVAWQCEAGRLHVDDDRICMETPGGGNYGEIRISELRGRTQPLLRYRTGDFGKFVSWEALACPCGRALGTLEEFEGRRRGFIVLNDQSLFSPKPLKLFLTELPLDGWQINQAVSGRLEVLLDPSAGYDLALAKERVRSWFLAHLPGRVCVEVKCCKSSKFLRTGPKLQIMNLEAYCT